MDTVTIRQARQRPSELIGAAERGASVMMTRRRRKVARLVPAHAGPGPSSGALNPWSLRWSCLNRRARVFVLIAIASACGLASRGCAHREADGPAADFVISDLGVTFGPWDPATNTAGDFVFLAREQKVFLEFGAVVADEGGGTKELPTFEYRVRKDALVRAIADGEVIIAEFQEETHDYGFLMRSTQNPSFQVGYDHVLNPTVGLGDVVRAGDVLGNPGTWSEQLGRFEIMINDTETGLSCCPFSFFDPALKEQYQQGVSSFIADWETFKGDPGIYDEENHVCPGCRYESMVTY